MDKVMKINSRQGGPFAATNNLVDFDIPGDGTYDMTNSFVNLVANVANVVEGTTPGARPTAAPSVYVNRLYWDDDGKLGAGTAPDSVHNVSMVKNCSWSTELQAPLKTFLTV